MSERTTVVEWSPPERLAHQADHGVTIAWSLICEDDGVRVVAEISGILYDDREAGRDERGSWWQTWLGILHVTTAEHETVRGSRIVRVIPDSPVEAAGLRPGDVVVGIDDQQVNSLTDLAQSLVYRTPCERVTLRIIRDRASGELAVPLVLEKRSDDPQ